MAQDAIYASATENGGRYPGHNGDYRDEDTEDNGINMSKSNRKLTSGGYNCGNSLK
jgi:hypothetical protein